MRTLWLSVWDTLVGGRRRVLGPAVSTSPLVGYVAAAIYAVSGTFASGSNGWSVFGVGFAAASASLIAGALLGFLFGLPRVLEKANANPERLLATNTNLDEISDWLTKILVGLGLVQLGKLMRGMNHVATALVPGLGQAPGAREFAFALLVYCVIDGFLVGYLWTRIVISIRLNEAAERLARVQKVAGEVRGIPPPAQPPPLPPRPLAASGAMASSGPSSRAVGE
jgi:hypothetical protein